MMSLTKLKAILDERFGPPFLRKNHVKTRWVKAVRNGPGTGRRTLSVTIGRRNIWIEPDGTISATGTDLRVKA